MSVRRSTLNKLDVNVASPLDIRGRPIALMQCCFHSRVSIVARRVISRNDFRAHCTAADFACIQHQIDGDCHALKTRAAVSVRLAQKQTKVGDL